MNLWDADDFGCIERDSFALHGQDRIALSSLGIPPTISKKADVAAPITASIQTNQTFAQWTAFTQWFKFDLANGSLPFQIDLWLWNHTRTVRARFIGPWKSRRQVYNAFVTQATIEIERESILW